MSNLTLVAVTPTATPHLLILRGERSAPLFPHYAGGSRVLPQQVFSQPAPRSQLPWGSMTLPSRRPYPPPATRRFPFFPDPLELFSRRRVTSKSSREEQYSSNTATTSTEEPPLVYFPDGEEGECGDFASSGFDTYSFVGFLLGVVNIVAQVANNVNNNLNNNNNNNNDNNNNLDNINAANSNSNQNNMNTVNIPGGRRRRDAPQEESWREQRRRRRRLHDEEAVAASVALPFLRAFWLLSAPPATNRWEECSLRAVCEANSLAARGLVNSELAHVFAEVFTEALAVWSPAGGVSKSLFASAGTLGRSGHDCSELSRGCSGGTWERLKKGVEDQHSLDMTFLKEEEGQEDLLQHITTHAEDFARMGLPDISAMLDMDQFV